jgi:hippurate hydrolase
VKTSELIAKKLTEYGYQVHKGFAKTGVVGVLKLGNGKKRIGFRADIDALPIQEQSGKSYCSKNAGKMHACGHDGHTAILLMAAKYLAQTKKFNGTLVVIFQPAEELLDGAKKMIEEGLFKKFPCDIIFGLHNMPLYKEGEIYLNNGAFLASSDSLDIEVTGVGGHGALPNKAVDATLIACYIGTALQTIVSRNVSPFDKAVITIGCIQSGEAYNIINGKALMKLTVRNYDTEVRKYVLKRIEEIAKKQAESFGGSAQVRHVKGCPVTKNGKEATEFAAKVAKEVFGEEKVHLDTTPLSGSEDFSFMLEAIPNGSYIVIGGGDKPNTINVHNPGYDFNDKIILPAAALWVSITQKYLK